MIDGTSSSHSINKWLELSCMSLAWRGEDGVSTVGPIQPEQEDLECCLFAFGFKMDGRRN